MSVQSLSKDLSAGIPNKTPQALIGLTLDELFSLTQAMGEPRFRAEQLHHWLYVKCVQDWEAMSNLSKAFREKLSGQYRVGQLRLITKQKSNDGTVKYLFGLDDGSVVESVLMYFEDRDKYSICISSQVGCAVDCGFCATGKLGFKRHLTVGEIVEQYLFVQHDSQEEVRNIVFMGQGEPLLNYDPLLKAIRILNRSAEVGIRHITVSTSGIVPRIMDLAHEQLQLTLAISLHAADNATREKIMPLNKKWPLEQLMPALFHYVRTTNRRLTIEYVLLAGVNDSESQARQLGNLLKGLKCNVNLIPYNPIGDNYGYQRPSREVIHRFATIVSDSGKKVTIRVERGVDIAAACGQLANQAGKT